MNSSWNFVNFVLFSGWIEQNNVENKQTNKPKLTNQELTKPRFIHSSLESWMRKLPSAFLFFMFCRSEKTIKLYLKKWKKDDDDWPSCISIAAADDYYEKNVIDINLIYLAISADLFTRKQNGKNIFFFPLKKNCLFWLVGWFGLVCFGGVHSFSNQKKKLIDWFYSIWNQNLISKLEENSNYFQHQIYQFHHVTHYVSPSVCVCGC